MARATTETQMINRHEGNAFAPSVTWLKILTKFKGLVKTLFAAWQVFVQGSQIAPDPLLQGLHAALLGRQPLTQLGDLGQHCAAAGSPFGIAPVYALFERPDIMHVLGKGRVQIL